MRREGEIGVTEAARLLEMHPDTIRDWAREAVSGGEAKITKARRDLGGRYYGDAREIYALRGRDPADYF
jgi:DNA-binding transcriptional MerR regulator